MSRPAARLLAPLRSAPLFAGPSHRLLRPSAACASPVGVPGVRRRASTLPDAPALPLSAQHRQEAKRAAGRKRMGDGIVGSSEGTQRAEVTLRRFWKTVGIMKQGDGSYHITLDGRPLKTPLGARLSIPANRRVLAMLIANEWENQTEVLKVSGLPMTSLASRALDGMTKPEIREGVTAELLRYLHTDTTCFPSDGPSPLVKLQESHWEPLHEWYRSTHGAEIRSYEDLVLGGQQRFEQSPETTQRLAELVKGFDEFQMAALERATYACKSFLIAFALVSGRLTADQAATASQVEVLSQIELWGLVEDSHDVDQQDIRKALGSAVCVLAKH